MDSLAGLVQEAPGKEAGGAVGPRLAGVAQKAAMAAWAVLFLVCLLSFGSSLVALNIWDRTPAAQLPGYFSWLGQEGITARSQFQAEVLSLGFSLPAFAWLLTVARLIGGLALFYLSAALVWRYPSHLMPVLFAILLAVMGAGGIWENPLFGWAALRMPWVLIPTQILNALLWFGLILVYAFPDGRFTPRWTVWLALLLVPLGIASAFDLKFFLNPNTWPAPLPLLPNLVFISVAFYAVLYRYGHTPDVQRKAALRGYVLGIALLMVLYFIEFFLIDVYETLAGSSLFLTPRAFVLYILVSEPLWFLLELVFAVLVSRAFFRNRMLEA